jgi:methanogenic corrinoid protein MtbC1
MDYMQEVVDAVRASGLDVKIMVGGAPVNADFAAKIGADGYSANANEAVAVAKRLLA